MKMFGRLGWHGQCGCCAGPRSKRQEKMSEEKQWRDEYLEEEDDPFFQELLDAMTQPIDPDDDPFDGMGCVFLIPATKEFFEETSGVLQIPDTIK